MQFRSWENIKNEIVVEYSLVGYQNLISKALSDELRSSLPPIEKLKKSCCNCSTGCDTITTCVINGWNLGFRQEQILPFRNLNHSFNTFGIERSLSMKGYPYDNAVAESTYKMIKTEFIKQRTFTTLSQLQLELADYVNWFNNHRIHSALNYLTPKEFERNTLKKVV